MASTGFSSSRRKAMTRTSRTTTDSRELPQVSFLSRQNIFCHDKIMFVATNVLSQQTSKLVATNVLLQQNYVCRDTNMFVTTKTSVLLSRQTTWFVATDTCVCSDKHFVATKMILAAAPANDKQQHDCGLQ